MRAPSAGTVVPPAAAVTEKPLVVPVTRRITLVVRLRRRTRGVSESAMYTTEWLRARGLAEVEPGGGSRRCSRWNRDYRFRNGPDDPGPGSDATHHVVAAVRDVDVPDSRSRDVAGCAAWPGCRAAVTRVPGGAGACHRGDDPGGEVHAPHLVLERGEVQVAAVEGDGLGVADACGCRWAAVPVDPSTPVPAIVVMTPSLLTRRMRWWAESAMKSPPFLLTATSCGH